MKIAISNFKLNKQFPMQELKHKVIIFLLFNLKNKSIAHCNEKIMQLLGEWTDTRILYLSSNFHYTV